MEDEGVGSAGSGLGGGVVVRVVALPWFTDSSTAARLISTFLASLPVVSLFSRSGWAGGSDGPSSLGAGVLSLSWHFTGVGVEGIGSDSGLGVGFVAGLGGGESILLSEADAGAGGFGLRFWLAVFKLFFAALQHLGL